MEENKEKNDRIIPTLSSQEMSAEKAIINNYGSPIITNLIVNFTKPGQVAKYNFYVYNAGEYVAYLNSIYYENIGRTNLSKVCITKDGTSNDNIKNACDYIKVSIKVGDLTTSKSLYYISNRSLRPRTAQPVEVTIEYLNNDINLKESFDVIFGDIKLSYSMYPNGSNSSEV